MPEQAYAAGLAAFRLAMSMRDDPAVSDLDGSTGCRRHLADARRALQPVSRKLTRTILAVCGLIENDFSLTRDHLGDRRIENALAWFQHVVNGSSLWWAADGGDSIHLVIDANTETLVEAVECLRQGDEARADELLAALANACADGRDVACVKKIAAVRWWRNPSASTPEILQGDPVFVGMLQRGR